VTLLGRVKAAHDGVIDFAPDLADSLAGGDAVYSGFLDMADAHIERHRLDMPEDPAARAVLTNPRCVTELLRRLDVGGDGIGAVIWATGYGVDFGWIDIPVRDTLGEPLHRHGITAVPGLYFLGLQWLSKMNSPFLSGVGDDAAVLADHIAARA
jgi:putative flavoprotein involved in K+ transport